MLIFLESIHTANAPTPTCHPKPPMTALLLPPQHIENLAIPSELDGSDGNNRSRNGTAQIAAPNDLDAIRAWLARFVDTKTTFDNYRKEAERLLLWSVLQMGKPLSSLTHEDLLVYQHFLADPQPAARWTANGGRKHPRGDPRWRPFYGPLSATSQRQAMVILNVMFAWLVQAGYLAGNPLSLSRQRARRAKPRITRYLSPELWLEVKSSIQTMVARSAGQRRQGAAGAGHRGNDGGTGYLPAGTRTARPALARRGHATRAANWPVAQTTHARSSAPDREGCF
jgi:hypothetical protein